MRHVFLLVVLFGCTDDDRQWPDPQCGTPYQHVFAPAPDEQVPSTFESMVEVELQDVYGHETQYVRDDLGTIYGAVGEERMSQQTFLTELRRRYELPVGSHFVLVEGWWCWETSSSTILVEIPFSTLPLDL